MDSAKTSQGCFVEYERKIGNVTYLVRSEYGSLENLGRLFYELVRDEALKQECENGQM